jgi:hypothetical protein
MLKKNYFIFTLDRKVALFLIERAKETGIKLAANVSPRETHTAYSYLHFNRKCNTLSWWSDDCQEKFTKDLTTRKREDPDFKDMEELDAGKDLRKILSLFNVPIVQLGTHRAEINDKGDVQIGDLTIDSPDFDEIVNVRKKYLKRKQ